VLRREGGRTKFCVKLGVIGQSQGGKAQLKRPSVQEKKKGKPTIHWMVEVQSGDAKKLKNEGADGGGKSKA